MGKTELKKNLVLKSFILISVFFVFFPNKIDAQDVNISVSAAVRGTSTAPEPPIIPPEGPKGSYVPPDTEIVFKGRAFPSALVTILKNDVVVANFKADETGLFERTIKGIAGGIYSFSVFAEDTEGKKTEALTFKVTVLENMVTTISKIFIPSTISLTPQSVLQGEEISVFGQSFPGSTVRIFISPSDLVRETSVSVQGKWSISLETDSLEEGDYRVKSQSFFGEGEQSGFSRELAFKIKKKLEACRGADLNLDKKVDLTDFSILLYFWEQNKPSNRCADINSDGLVDIVDFSIMMYQWNG